MKKLIFVLFILLIFASSASATIYRWVDEKGVVNFTDDVSKIPPNYRNNAEEVKVTKMGPSTPSQTPPGKIAASAQPGETGAQAPPISQALVREGDFAVKLAESLKVGQPKSEAEAETMLTSAGIAPKNGWIADYPVTPDIIGELENSVGSAVDAGKLGIKKEEATRAFQNLAVQEALPVRADEGQNSQGSTEPPQNYGESEAVSNYYYDEGPPVVTYYPPPWDYSYLYAWVPYPFWFTGFWFPGFFVLNDFHRHCFTHGHVGVVSNHFSDPRTGRLGAIDPARRHLGNAAASPHPSRGQFASQGARNGASSILNRSSGNTRLNTTAETRGAVARNPQSARMSGYSSRGGVVTGRSMHSRSLGHPGSFSGYGRGTGRSFSGSFSGSPSKSFSALSTGGRGSFGGSSGGGGGSHGGGRGGGHGGGHR